MNTKLSAEDRTEMVLKPLTFDEKLALLHGNGTYLDEPVRAWLTRRYGIKRARA
jgi:beta-glucosidase